MKFVVFSMDHLLEKFLQVTTPLLFKLIPAVIHLGVLVRWFSPDSSPIEVISSFLVSILLRAVLLSWFSRDMSKWYMDHISLPHDVATNFVYAM